MRRRRFMTWILTMVMALAVFGVSASVVFGADLAGSGTEDNPYLITSAEDFASMQEGESGIGKYYQLDGDITISQPFSGDFQGIFDGDGHTVTLAIESAATYQGMFGSLKSGAVVTDVITDGSVVVTGGKSYTGAIAASANGFENGVTIEYCRNNASLSGYKAVGGIVGSATNGVTITECVNSGAITGENMQVGGIVGNAASGVTAITDCYNTGVITGFNQVGGIIGQATKSSAYDSMTNCYSTGTCSLTTTNTGVGSLAGNKSNNGTITNSYGLDTAAASLVGGATSVTGAAMKTADEMKAADFAAALGEAFAADSKAINSGYPILAWEDIDDSGAKATVAFDVTPEDAVIKVGKKAVTDGMIDLGAGSYQYTISCEGYKTVTGTFEVTEAQAENEDVIELDPISLPSL